MEKVVYPERSRRSFTLIEIIVATTIFAIAIVMVTASFGMANKWQKQVKANREIAEAGRFAMEKISRDVRSAKAIEVSSDASILTITNQDGSTILYSIDPINKTLNYNTSQLIDSSKVIVENDPGVHVSQWFVQASANGDFVNVQLLLSPKSNPDKTTKFLTAAAIRNYQQ